MTMELPFHSVRLSIHPFSHLLQFIHGEGRSAVGKQRNTPDRSPVQQLRQHKHINTLKAIYSFSFHLDYMSLEWGRKVKQSHVSKEGTWEIHVGRPWLGNSDLFFPLSTAFVFIKYNKIMSNLNLCCEVSATESPRQAVAVVVFSPHWARGRILREQVASLSQVWHI